MNAPREIRSRPRLHPISKTFTSQDEADVGRGCKCPSGELRRQVDLVNPGMLPKARPKDEELQHTSAAPFGCAGEQKSCGALQRAIPFPFASLIRASAGGRSVSPRGFALAGRETSALHNQAWRGHSCLPWLATLRNMTGMAGANSRCLAAHDVRR